MKKLQMNLTMVSGDRVMIIPCEKEAQDAELVQDGENDVSLKYTVGEKTRKVLLGETSDTFVFLGKYKPGKNSEEIEELKPYLVEYHFMPDECFIVVKKYREQNEDN